MFERVERIFNRIQIPVLIVACFLGVVTGVYFYAQGMNLQDQELDLIQWRKTCVLENLKHDITESVAVGSCKVLEEQYVRLRNHNWQ
jgi:hypothetical protein